MTLRSELVNELEKAFTDEAYDGGMGALSEDEFAHLVRTLAETAHSVFEKAYTPADEEREASKQELCDRCGWALSGHVRSQYGPDCPPGGSRPGFRRSEVPEPSASREKLIALLRSRFAWHSGATFEQDADAILALLEPEPQGEPYDAVIRQAVLDGLDAASVLQSPFQPQTRELVVEQITLALRAGGVR